MSWQDTVMSDEQIREAKRFHSGFTSHIHVADVAIAEAQAKRTWKARDPEIKEVHKAGIKEVVEWRLELCPHKTNPLEFRAKQYCELCWQAKIKEWGLSNE